MGIPGRARRAQRHRYQGPACGRGTVGPQRRARDHVSRAWTWPHGAGKPGERPVTRMVPSANGGRELGQMVVPREVAVRFNFLPPPPWGHSDLRLLL